MNRRLLMSIFLLMTACACHGSPARAALIVTVGDLNLREGGSGFVDVMISSSDGSDVLDSFAIDLLISQGPGVERQLKFVDLGEKVPSDKHLTDEAYLFFNDSAVLNDNGFGGFGSLISPTLYSGGDATISPQGVFVPATPTLLVRLEVTADTVNRPEVGDKFTISVEREFSLFLPDPSDLILESGTVTITASSAAIPEPASMAIWAILLTVSMICMGRRRKAVLDN